VPERWLNSTEENAGTKVKLHGVDGRYGDATKVIQYRRLLAFLYPGLVCCSLRQCSESYAGAGDRRAREIEFGWRLGRTWTHTRQCD